MTPTQRVVLGILVNAVAAIGLVKLLWYSKYAQPQKATEEDVR